MVKWLIPAGLVLLLCAAKAEASISARYFEITPLGGATALPKAINDAGQVVGWSNINGFGYGHAFLWQNGATTLLPSISGGLSTNSAAEDINSSGEIVGAAYKNYPAPVLWDLSLNPTDLEPAQYFAEGSMFAVNDNGIATGSVDNVTGASHAVYWSAATGIVDIGQGYGPSAGTGINNNGVICGYGRTGSASYAWTWSSQMGRVVLPHLSDVSAQSDAYAINSSGQVVGDSMDAQYNYHGMLWQPDGTFLDLGTFFGQWFRPTDINDAGEIIGYAATSSSEIPFIWRDGQLEDIRNLLLNSSGWSLRRPWGINNLGQIVGEGVSPTGASVGVLLTPVVPEPRALGLTAAILLLWTRRFSNRQSSRCLVHVRQAHLE